MIDTYCFHQGAGGVFCVVRQPVSKPRMAANPRKLHFGSLYLLYDKKSDLLGYHIDLPPKLQVRLTRETAIASRSASPRALDEPTHEVLLSDKVLTVYLVNSSVQLAIIANIALEKFIKG